MSSVIISGDTSGAITLSAPAVSGTNTATLPAATGTVMVSGNMPAFNAYPSSAQTGVASVTFTKVLFDTKRFDTNSNFASSRFTPTIAGYYQVNGTVSAVGSASALTRLIVSIYVNGAEYVRGFDVSATEVNGVNTGGTASAVIYFNGSTDYAEMYAFGQVSSGTISFGSAPANSCFSASMVRAA